MQLAPEAQALLVIEALQKHPDAYLIAIVGVPGSGKTTLCETISSRLPDCAILYMDGYHIPRKQLSGQDLKRRGAPHTFDRHQLRQDLEQLRKNRQGQFPSFDHASKDPDPEAIQVTSQHSRIFVEGNYLLLSDWDLEPLFDFTVFLGCNMETAMNRVTERLHACGICPTREAARLQVENNDKLNARQIIDDNTAERADLCLAQGK